MTPVRTGSARRSTGSQKRIARARGTAKAIILESARELFSENGYANTSTRAVAERADVVEALIFRHFGSKRQLFRQSMWEPFEQIIQDFTGDLRVAFEAEGGQGLLARYLEALFDFATTNRKLLIALMSAAEFESEGGESGLDELGLDSPIDRLVLSAGQLFEELEGATRDVDLDVLIRLVLTMVLGIGVFEPWIFSNKKLTKVRIINEMTALIRTGVMETDLFPEKTKPRQPRVTTKDEPERP